MEDKSKEEIMEQLRQTLLNYIDSNDKVLFKFNKILRQLTVIFIALGLASLVGIAFIIYTIGQPPPGTAIAMKQIEDLNKSILSQRRFIQMDRQDVAKAREQVIVLMTIQDSIKQTQDSITEIEFQKATK